MWGAEERDSLERERKGEETCVDREGEREEKLLKRVFALSGLSIAQFPAGGCSSIPPGSPLAPMTTHDHSVPCTLSRDLFISSAWMIIV